jgi:hypothetical protein
MLRTAVATLLAVPALALSGSAYATTTDVVTADVHSSGPSGEKIPLTLGVKAAGLLKISSCANASPTAFVCKGTGTVKDLSGKVKIRWRCPVNKSCAKTAEGTLKNHGSTLALLHVKASVETFQTRGSTFSIEVEYVGE